MHKKLILLECSLCFIGDDSVLQVLKQSLGMIAPDVEIDDGLGTIMISSEEGETEGKIFLQISWNYITCSLR